MSGERRRAIEARVAAAAARLEKEGHPYDFIILDPPAFTKARRTVENMSRAGQLHRVRDRKVEYRNRPVAEYVPAAMQGDDDGFVDLAQVLRVWG